MHTDGEHAANSMDELSDWVGSFVPGCTHLGPRHPIRVTLVLGGLGLITGWAMTAVGVISILVVSSNQLFALVMPLAVAICLGIPGAFVMRPFALWNESVPLRPLGMIPGSIIAHMTALPFALVIEAEPFVGLFCFAAALTTFLVAFATGTSPYEFVIYCVAVTATTITGIVSVGGMVWLSGSSLLPTEPLMWWSAACVLGTYYATLGASLGFTLWDVTPPPKFQPAQSAAPQESEA